MSASRFSRVGLSILTLSFAGAFSACTGGGGGSASTLPSSVYEYTNGTYLTYIGGYNYTDTSNGDVVTFEGNGLYYDDSSGEYEYADGISTASKDTDLQKANVQKKSITARAQTIANRFQMNLNASVQLVQLSDRVAAMMQLGQMTNADRVAVTNSALSIASVTPSEVNQAIANGFNGDDSAASAVLAKAAKNLDMPSASSLRDQLLPALGVNIQGI